MVPEWELTFALSNLAKTFYLRTRLRETIVRDLSYYKRKIILRSTEAVLKKRDSGPGVFL